MNSCSWSQMSSSWNGLTSNSEVLKQITLSIDYFPFSVLITAVFIVLHSLQVLYPGITIFPDIIKNGPEPAVRYWMEQLS